MKNEVISTDQRVAKKLAKHGTYRLEKLTYNGKAFSRSLVKKVKK